MGQRHDPATPYPRERPATPLYRRVGRPQGRSGEVRKISPPPGFDPRTVQPVGSRYTDYNTRPMTAEYRLRKGKHSVKFLGRLLASV